MKKSAFPAALLLLGVFMSGCPVYDDDGCFGNGDCASGSVCDGDTGRCVEETTEPTLACHRPLDCDGNETCSRFGTCLAGDCHFPSVGCVRGYECSIESGKWQCVKPAPVGAGGNGGSAASGAASVGGEPNSSEGGTSAAGAGG